MEQPDPDKLPLKERILYYIQEVLDEKNIDWVFKIEDILGIANDSNPPLAHAPDVIRVDALHWQGEPCSDAYKITFKAKSGAEIRFNPSFRFYPTSEWLPAEILRNYMREGFDKVYSVH
jgi:hypothetical protein